MKLESEKVETTLRWVNKEHRKKTRPSWQKMIQYGKVLAVNWVLIK